MKVAVLGYPNVGKSSLVNRLSGRARGGRARAPGGRRATATRSSASGTAARFKLIDTGGVDFRDEDPLAGSIRDQARAGLADAQVAVLVVDARAGVRAGRRGARGPAAPLAAAGDRGGEQVRRRRRHAARGRVPPPRPGRADAGLRRPGPRLRATCSTGSSSCCLPREQEPDGGHAPPRGDRAPERRQVLARQPLPRRGARDRLRARRHHARRDRPAAERRRAAA